MTYHFVAVSLWSCVVSIYTFFQPFFWNCGDLGLCAFFANCNFLEWVFCCCICATMFDKEWTQLIAQVKQKGQSMDLTKKWRTTMKIAGSLGLAGDLSTGKQSQGISHGFSMKPMKLRCFFSSGRNRFECGKLRNLEAVCIASGGGFTLSDAEHKRIIVESFLWLVLEADTFLDTKATSAELLELFDWHYGEFSDGYKLYTQFSSLVQEVKETARGCLQHLHHLLALRMTRRGGIKTANIAREGMCQFECSCADEVLLHRVDIHGFHKKSQQVPVVELFLQYALKSHAGEIRKWGWKHV